MDDQKDHDVDEHSDASKVDDRPAPENEYPLEQNEQRLTLSSYHDSYITCTATALTIRAYYFPWGSKIIPLATVRGVERVPMGAFQGRGRIWGTANPGIWAHLDPSRPSKTEGLLLDIGQSVRPLITPDDMQALVDFLGEV